MARKRKYKRGRLINSIGQLEKIVNQGDYIFMFHKPMHPGWIKSMTLNTLCRFIQYKRLRQAELIEQKEKV